MSGRRRPVMGYHSFEEIMDTRQGRALVEALEDTLASLRDHEDDPVLLRVRDNFIAQIEELYGYTYRLD